MSENVENTNGSAQEQYRTLKDNDVLDVAVKMMDRFDEAFKELAK